MGVMKTLTINGVTYDVVPVVPAKSVTLLASAWVTDGEIHSQVVAVPGVSVHTKVDLQPTSEQLAEFHYKVLAFVAENDGGIVTVYSVGDKPSGDHTIQITLTEVEGTGKIRGNTVGTTMPRTDFNQTDSKQADYLVGREKIVQTVNGIAPDENGNVEVEGGSGNINPVAKTEDMTQPVGMDENGKLWTAPTSGESGGETEEPEDILLGTLPMTISENNCYLLSETNATISTGEGAAQLLDFDVTEPYIGDTTYNGAAFEKLGKNTLKVGFANVARNASVFFQPNWESGKTYTIVGKLIDKTSDIASNNIPYIRINHAGNFVQLNLNTDGTLSFKTFTAGDTTTSAFAAMATVSATYVAGETYATIAVYIYEGEHTEIPSGATFDIVAGEKYNTDGYIGSTLSAVNGETVEVYQTNTSGAETETDNGGVIFFGDSILHYSDVVSRYAAKTGKSVVNCAVGGTRMSASRDSTNAYYPVDMANIADAIASGDFTAQLNSGVATAGFTTLASANIGNYKAIVLEFGTNDFSAKVPFEGDDATSISGALKHILTTILTKYPNMRIVVLSTLQYVTLGSGNESGVPTHDDGTVWQMNEAIKGVCESDEFCVPFVDMYHAFGQNAITRNTLNSDGVHLTSPNGAKRYADILTAKLNGLGI